ncbi:pseudouridine-5'-phosphatase-like [Polistes fuscatus]|uniref:pseudouridine-5'-phosphatase-like n=1 Tax=Polistes fuscatus TaxID=30207 RepID=UPI001CA94047|nr:pseudouridine-5'-phosphatase-like [Polistes fuscatus]
MAANNYKKVTHCIFDMDGLLLDTETLYSQAFNQISQKYGKDYTWEHKIKIMGFKSSEAAKTIVEMLELPISGPEFERQLSDIYVEIFPKCNLMPGAERLLKHLKNNNVPIALATSSSKSTGDIKTQRWEHIFDLFHHRVYGGTDPEVKKGKPNPDIFLIAAQRFPDKPEPSKCLVFEDSPNGVEAAVAAGMQVIMVPDPMLDEKYFKGATIVLKSLEDFRPELFGLPPY